MNIGSWVTDSTVLHVVAIAKFECYLIAGGG